MNPVTELIESFGLAGLAALCGVSYQAVRKWEAAGRVPASRVVDVHRATDAQVSLHRLNPDVYPDPEWKLPPKPAVTVTTAV